jgi:hypothetical protein
LWGKKDKKMQVLVFKQDFGRLAIGMSNMDTLIEDAQHALNDRSEGDQFFKITRGGVSNHPWERDSRNREKVLAIVGDDLIDNLDANPVLFSAFQYHHQGEVLLNFRKCKLNRVPKNLPSPAKLWEDCIYHDRHLKSLRILVWGNYSEFGIPEHIKVILDKTLAETNRSFTQGAHFFGKRR